jgi:hypothetical protein
MMKTIDLQKYLLANGFSPGALDGEDGPKTQAAHRALKAHLGKEKALPWIAEIMDVWELHEARDTAELSAWLRSDGPTLGDPRKLPWCGDAVETAVFNALPEEPRFENPYWARNWGAFGVPCDPVYGAIVVFKRGSGGHVGFLVGKNLDGTLLRVRGGNQGDAVNDTWIRSSRLLDDGMRWPSTWTTRDQRPLPILNPKGATISQNEA